jgi:hypothetical protein
MGAAIVVSDNLEMGDLREVPVKAPDAVISDRESDARQKGTREDELGTTSAMLDAAYSHVHEDSGGNGRKWLAILMSVVLIISLVVFRPPENANWIYWSATLGRLAIIVWLIARYAREP